MGRSHLSLPTELGYLALLSCLWGGSYALIRIGVESIQPITLVAARALIAGLLLLAVLRLRQVPLPKDGASWLAFFVQGLLNSALPFTLLAWAQQTVGAGLATVLNSLSPVFAFGLAALLGAREGSTLSKSLGIACGLGGVAVIVGSDAVDSGSHLVLPHLAIVFASACYAGAALFGRRFRSLDSMIPAAASLLCASALLVPLSLAVERPWHIVPSPASALACITLAVFSTALAMVIYFRLNRTLGAVGVTAQAYLRVPVGVAIGVAFLDERLSALAWLGSGLVLIGVLAMTWPPPRSK